MASPASSDATAPSSAKAVALSHANFAKEVIEYPSPAFVFFHAGLGDPVDGAVADVLKQLDILQSKYLGLAVVGHVDCSDDATMKEVCRGTQGLEKVPAMRVFAAYKKRNPYTKKWYKESEEFDGQPVARQMSMAIQSQLVDDSIPRIASMKDWDNWVDSDPLAKVLVFTDKMEPSVLVKGLAMHYNQRLLFALVSPEVQELMDEFGVEKVPAVVLRRSNGDVLHYSGSINAVALQGFLAKHAPERVQDEVNRKNLEDTAPIFTHAPRYSNVSLPDVPAKLASEDIWILFFIARAALEDASLRCTRSLQAFQNATRDVGEMFAIGLVALGADEVQGASAAGADPAYLAANPCNFQVKIKPFGDDVDAETDLVDYSGPFEGKALLDELYELVPEFTTHMTTQSLPGFLGMQPGGVNPFTPKAVLITNKLEAPGLYKVLALNFRKRDLAFGWFSTQLDKEILQQFNAPRVPAVMVVYIDPTTPADAKGQVPLMMEPFQMALKYTYLENFLETIADRHGRGADQGGTGDDKEEYSGSVRHDIGPLRQLQSDADMGAACTGKGGICLFAFLDAAASALQEHLELLQLIRSIRKDQALQFMWIDVASQATFASEFGLSAMDAPTVILWSPRKLRYARLTGAFSQDSIKQLIDRLMTGQVSTAPLSQVPTLIEGGESQPLLEDFEEEFDLSEILSEEVADESGDRAAQLAKATEEAERDARAAEEAAAEQTKKTRKSKKKAKKSKAKNKTAKAHDEL